MAAYRQAILLRPDFAQAHSNLGNGLRDQGDLEQAAAHYRTALTFIPEWAEAHYNLAGVVASQGRLEEAVAGYQQALALKPDFAEAHNNLGSLFKTLGRSEAALGCFRQALVLKPDYAEAHNNLGNVLKEQGHGAGAVAHYQRAIVLRPSFAEAHNNLGTVFQDQGLIDQAVVQYRRALALNPDYAEAHYNLGVVHQDRGLLDAAAACYRLAVAKRPDFVEAYNNLGNTLKDQGRFQEALTRYDQALALKPDFAEVLFNRAELKTCQPGDPDVARLEALAADRRSLSADGAPFIHFALAKALDETGESVRAFQHLLMGNAAKRRQVVYDETASQDLFRRVAAAFDAGMFEHRRNTGAPSTIPIFVLGMPRSGSSLVEQILASHPEIQGGGELPTLAGVVGGGEPETAARLDDAALTDLGAAYLARLPPLAAGKTRLTDKMPYNFLYVGLIRLILPGARIIHTRRDPVETCVSCFSKLFPTGQAYSYDLGELGRYYRGYNALMAHWRSVLPADAML